VRTLGFEKFSVRSEHTVEGCGRNALPSGGIDCGRRGYAGNLLPEDLLLRTNRLTGVLLAPTSTAESANLSTIHYVALNLLVAQGIRGKHHVSLLRLLKFSQGSDCAFCHLREHLDLEVIITDINLQPHQVCKLLSSELGLTARGGRREVFCDPLGYLTPRGSFEPLGSTDLGELSPYVSEAALGCGCQSNSGIHSHGTPPAEIAHIEVFAISGEKLRGWRK
jgi:hypothetical protein